MAASFAQGQTVDKQAYLEDLEKWRAEQTAELKGDEGFLSVSGLFWLKEGDNTIGSDESNSIKLTKPVPAHLGILKRLGNIVNLVLEDGAGVTLRESGRTQEVNGSRGQSLIPLKSDSTRVALGSLSFMVITRGQRVGVRVFDKACPGYLAFQGQKWFEPDLNYRIRAKFVPYNPPKTVNITNVLGDTTPVKIIGYAEFALEGRIVQLDAQRAGEGLFINFRDLTSGKETYPAGRFLDTAAPHDGFVVLDFNRATNPPCAFTAFATCPLPPKSNYLNSRIPAGEKTHHPVTE